MPSGTKPAVFPTLWNNGRAAFAFLAPAVVALALIGIFPTVFALVNSFRRYNLARPRDATPFVGFDNYLTVFYDPSFWGALGRTFTFLVTVVPIQIALGLAIALLLHKPGLSGFKLLARLKFLRGTPFDPFGYAAERRRERAAIREYEADMREVLANVTDATMPVALELAELPLTVRGFGPVKAQAEVAAAARRSERGTASSGRPRSAGRQRPCGTSFSSPSSVAGLGSSVSTSRPWGSSVGECSPAASKRAMDASSSASASARPCQPSALTHLPGSRSL